MGPAKSRPCCLCGRPVNRAGRGTAEHHVNMMRCDGSDLAYAAHSEPRQVIKTPVKRSPLNRVLARLRGRGHVIHVDFAKAREQRALGYIAERSHALRFVVSEVRDA